MTPPPASLTYGVPPVDPEFPNPGKPPPPKGLVVLPCDCCCWASDWLPSVAVVVRLLSPT